MQKAILFRKTYINENLYVFRPIEVTFGEYDKKGGYFNTIHGFSYSRMEDPIMINDIEDMVIGFIEKFDESENMDKYFDRYKNSLCVGIYNKNADEVNISVLSQYQIAEASKLKGNIIDFSLINGVNLDDLEDLSERDQIIINYLKKLIIIIRGHFKGTNASLYDKNVIFDKVRELTNFRYFGTSIENVTYIDLCPKVQSKIVEECKILREYIKNNWNDCLIDFESTYGKIYENDGHSPKTLK